MASKLSFRARNLDATKSMPVYVADELPDLSDCAPINRAVAQMPTGMEKDEEMELHLQEAILAQQASTSGITVKKNHVIPTPQVKPVSKSNYDSVYPVQPAPSANQLIKVQASLSLGNDEPDYDIDSEDEVWLADRGGTDVADDFEKMMELLEGASSDTQICQPKEARFLLKDFDNDLVDDVYDYWLQKRKDAAASCTIASLIPRVKTRDTPGTINPYVGFRRRAEKMQTRKNRKNDEESYEKIMRLGYDLGRAVVLYDMLRKREHMKLALIDLDVHMLKKRWASEDFNAALYSQAISKAKSELSGITSPNDESQEESSGSMSSIKTKGHRRNRISYDTVVLNIEKNTISRSWLRKNAEKWCRPATAASVLNAECCTGAAASAETDRNVEGAVDGRYMFKRRRGCVYRASIPLTLKSLNDDQGTETERMYCTQLVSRSMKSVRRSIGYTRKRIGRGGRIIFDRVLGSRPSTSQNAPDPPYFCNVNVDMTGTGSLEVDSDGLSEDADANSFDELAYAEREDIYARRIFGLGTAGSERLRTGAARSSVPANGGMITLEVDPGMPQAYSSSLNYALNGSDSGGLQLTNIHQKGRSSHLAFTSQVYCLSKGPPSGKECVGTTHCYVQCQHKRVNDRSGLTSQLKAATATGEDDSPIFQRSLPASPHVAQTLEGTGEQSKLLCSNVAPPTPVVCSGTVPLSACVPKRVPNLSHRYVSVPSQEISLRCQNSPSRSTPQKHQSGSWTVTQLANSLIANYGKSMNSDGMSVVNSCVDTKRLELAIAGSGARIKPANYISTSSSLPLTAKETQTLKDLLKAKPSTKYVSGGGFKSAAITNAAVAQFGQQFVSAADDVQLASSDTNLNATNQCNSCCASSTPCSEGFSPPRLLPSSPPVQNLSRHVGGKNDLRTQVSTAALSVSNTRRDQSDVKHTSGVNQRCCDGSPNKTRKIGFGEVQRAVAHYEQPQKIRDTCGDLQGGVPLRALPLASGGDIADLSPLRTVPAAKNFNGRKRSGSGISVSEDIATSKGSRAADALKRNTSYDVSKEMINYVVN